MNKIITIGREFGSGGRELGKRLAETLGYAYYDEEIIEAIAKRSELAEDYVRQVVENRIKTYHGKTEPLIAFYKKAGKYHEIDGVGTIEEVQGRIFDLMDRF